MGEEKLHLFGDYVLDTARGSLLRAGQSVHLRPQAFKTLKYLVENRGRLISKDQLIEEVWEGRAVTDDSLVQCLRDVRHALGEGSNQYLRNERGRGYIFDAETDGRSMLEDNAAWTEQVDLLRVVVENGERLGEHRYIVTVPGRGYRFVTGVRTLDKTVEQKEEHQVEPDGEEATEPKFKPNRKDERELSASTVSQLNPYSGVPKNRTRSVLIAGALLLGLGIAALYLWHARTKTVPVAPIKTIAVLPFANTSGDPNTEHLSDGISESLINSLSQLPQLKVIARSSSFKYKGKEVDPQDVARALGVGAIVTGRIVQRGDNLQISVELMNMSDKTQMWGEQYHRRAADIQAVQAEIARTVSEKLRLRLTGVQEQQLTKRATENAQAYRLYLTGVFHQRKGNMEGFKKALDYFDQAVALDAKFALAFASMPAVYSNLAATSGLDLKEAVAKGKVAAQKALELDETLAEAHNGLAVIKQYEWDWSGAESEFKRAIELNPNLAGAHSNYALYLAGMGRTAESLAENKRAQELDPLRISFKGNEGGTLFSARRYDEALQVFQNVIEMQPDYAFAHIGLGHTYVAKGMYAEAINEYQTAISLYGEVTNGLIDLGYAYAMSGKRDEALAILNKLKASKEYVSPGGLAILYAGLGDKEAAFKSLERAYSAHDLQLQSLKGDPRNDSLRSDPRFAAIMKRMNLE